MTDELLIEFAIRFGLVLIVASYIAGFIVGWGYHLGQRFADVTFHWLARRRGIYRSSSDWQKLQRSYSDRIDSMRTRP